MTKDKKYLSVIIVLILDIALFMLFMLGTGAILTGYHFIDDHVSISLYEALQNTSLYELTKANVIGDLTLRFRPLYFIELCLKTYFFGIDFNKWMLFSTLEGIITFMLLYLSAIKMKFTTVESFLFSSIIIFGKQFTPWYRTPNQENEGLLFVSILLLLLSIGFYGEKKLFSRWWYRIIVFMVMVISSLQKEAFCMMLPAYILLIMHMDEQTNEKSGFVTLVHKYLLLFISIMAVFLYEIYFIMTQVGTQFAGYAGFDESSGIGVYLKGLYKTCTKNIQFYIIAFVLLVIVFVLANKKDAIKKIVDNKYLALFGVFVIATQLILHAKSTMFQRYIIPMIVAVSLVFIVFGLRIIRDNLKWYRISVGICSALVLIGMIQSYQMAESWAIDGRDGNELLSAVEGVIQDNPSAKILSHIDDCELDLSVEVWLNHYVESDVDFTYYADVDNSVSYDVLLITAKKYRKGKIFKQLGVDADSYTSILSDDNKYVVLVLND